MRVRSSDRPFSFSALPDPLIPAQAEIQIARRDIRTLSPFDDVKAATVGAAFPPDERLEGAQRAKTAHDPLRTFSVTAFGILLA